MGAMEEEVSCLQDIITVHNSINKAGMVFFEGKLEGKDVILVHSGIGKVNAAICAQILIDIFGVERILFTGVAGAVATKLRIGDIVIGSDVMYHDLDCTQFGYELGQVPRLKVRAFPADKELVRLAREAAARVGESGVFVGRILTGDRFIADRCLAMELGSKLGGLCTEMEGAGVGHTCYLNGIPFLLIRCISDQANGTAPADFSKFYREAAKTATMIIKYILNDMQ